MNNHFYFILTPLVGTIKLGIHLHFSVLRNDIYSINGSYKVLNINNPTNLLNNDGSN